MTKRFAVWYATLGSLAVPYGWYNIITYPKADGAILLFVVGLPASLSALPLFMLFHTASVAVQSAWVTFCFAAQAFLLARQARKIG